MKKNNLVHLLVLFTAAVIYCFPVFLNIHNWGQMEWDQFTFWNAVPRATLLQYHQFPLWNPYADGGNVLLAHPHSLFLSPFYVLVLIFGPILGLKLEILVHMIVGLWGMYALARYFMLDKVSSYFSAVVFMMNSMYVLHLTEGHTEWLVMAFVPWFFLFLFKSFKDVYQALAAAVFLSLMVLGGSVDVLSITVVLLGTIVLFKVFQLRNLKPVLSLFIVLGGMFVLCAIKLLPMLEFIHQYPRETYARSATGFPVLLDMLFGRGQAYWDTLNWDTTQRMGLSYGWHEYGAYVGFIPIGLYLFGAIRSFKEHWPLILTGIVSLLIALGQGLPVDLWWLLHKLPLYDSLTVPSRFIFGFIFSVSLFSGVGLFKLKELITDRVGPTRQVRAQWLAYGILLVVFADLVSVNTPIFTHAFIIKPLMVKRQSDFHQRYTYINFHEKDKYHNIVGEEISNSSMYPIFLSNSGILEGNEVMHIALGDVKVLSDPNYRGEAYLAHNSGRVIMDHFSPNRIVLDVQASAPDDLVLNQNFYDGWKVKTFAGHGPAFPLDGLVSTPVKPGHQKVVFYYLPNSFLLGMFVSLSALCLFVLLWFGRRTPRVFQNGGLC